VHLAASVFGMCFVRRGDNSWHFSSSIFQTFTLYACYFQGITTTKYFADYFRPYPLRTRFPLSKAPVRGGPAKALRFQRHNRHALTTHDRLARWGFRPGAQNKLSVWVYVSQAGQMDPMVLQIRPPLLLHTCQNSLAHSHA